MDKHIIARLPRILSKLYENFLIKLATYTFTAGKRKLQDVYVQR